MQRDSPHLPIQADFMTQIGHDVGFMGLFNHLESVAFFVKNEAFQIVFANSHFYKRLGFQAEKDIAGRDDFELFPRPLATKFRQDDEKVLSNGEPMPGLVELFLSRQGLPDWFLTNKVPVLGQTGEIIGVMGTVQRYDHSRAMVSADPAIASAVDQMLNTPGTLKSISDLANRLSMSLRNFDRRFRQVTGLTPKQFLGRSRIQLACKLLRQSPESISEIAMEVGYCDQSALTAQFRKRMGFTPLHYRRRYGSKS